MRRGRVILIPWIGAVLAAGILLMAVTSREPAYGGRSLSEWLELRFASNASPDALTHAEEAIRQIGAEALPWLLHWIQYERSPRKGRLRATVDQLLGSLSVPWKDKNKAWTRAESAGKAFEILGPQARAALPDLARLLEDPAAREGARRAAYALGYLGTPALPILVNALTNQNASAEAHQSAAVVIPRLGTNAVMAVPALVQCLEGKHHLAASASADALGRLKAEPGLVVPALARSLDHSRLCPCIRTAAVRALYHFGDEARPAVPALRKALADPVRHVRQMATNILRNIDPEALEKATRR